MRILQSALRIVGYRLPGSFPNGRPDGDYQGEVSRAVLHFQTRHRLDRDGRAGPQVLMLLDRMLVQRGGTRGLPPLPDDLRRGPIARTDRTAVAVAPLPTPDTRVRADAGDRRLQTRRESVLPPAARSVPLNPVVAEVYAQAGELLIELIRTTRRALSEIGCGRGPSRSRFDVAIRRVFDAIATSDDQRGRLDALTARDARNKRRELITQVVRSLGGTGRQATEVAERELTGYRGRRTPGMQLSGAPTNREVIDSLFRSGCSLHDRLGELRREVEQRYRGTDNDPQAGIEQTFGLLANFPDVASDIYAAADLPNLAGVPPQIGGNTNLRAQTLVQAGERWEQRRRREEGFKAAGLIIVGLVVGVVSFGTLSALGATLATAGFTLATGAANIVARSGDYQQTADAFAIGAASPQTLELSEARLSGAYRGLVIDVLTMGVMARVGGSGNLGRFSQLVRIQGAGMAGAALSMATDPDVMRAPNAAGLILFGVAVNVLADVGADATAARFVARAGARVPVQVSVKQGEGSVRVGAAVGVAAGANDVPIQGQVRAVNPSSNTLTVGFDDGSTARVRVDRVDRVDTSSAVETEPPARVQPSAAAPSVPRAERSPSGGYIYYRAMGLGEARALQAGRVRRDQPPRPQPRRRQGRRDAARVRGGVLVGAAAPRGGLRIRHRGDRDPHGARLQPAPPRSRLRSQVPRHVLHAAGHDPTSPDRGVALRQHARRRPALHPDPTGDPPRSLTRYSIDSSSTSKTSMPAGRPGAPLYASSSGIHIRCLAPTDISCRPSVHPRMTAVSGKLEGSPRATELSNISPSVVHPV